MTVYNGLRVWPKGPCPRSHEDLKYRNPDISVDDLPLSMQNAYKDAVERGCGHDKATRYTRLEERMERETTEIGRVEDVPLGPETTSVDMPLEPGALPTVKAKVKRAPKRCSLCGQTGVTKATHGKHADPSAYEHGAETVQDAQSA